MERMVRYRFTIQNTTNRVLERAEFWTYGPVAQTSLQKTEHIGASHPFELSRDELGNQVLHFTFDKLAPYATKLVTITARLRLAQEPQRVWEWDVERFLRPEKFMQSDDKRLVELADSLATSKREETAKRLFEWVNKNVQYAGYTADDRGALYAYLNRKGDCTEYMYLFGALCRIKAIPARGVAGYVYAENVLMKASDYHNWAEIYMDRAWRVVDPQNGVFMDKQWQYIAMRILSAPTDAQTAHSNRFITHSDGLAVSML